ncbi:MAG: hypothetical protein JXR43_07780 [Burkholderiaceae bacterium]|nr:hypothetical protein [Burkholderiaceae bacterium]
MPVKLFRGDTWTRAWRMEDAACAPIDLTGASARLQLRDSAGALALDATTDNGRLRLTALEGRIDLLVPYADTALLAAATYRFDLEVTHASGIRRTYEQDSLVILEDVSHD